ITWTAFFLTGLSCWANEPQEATTQKIRRFAFVVGKNEGGRNTRGEHALINITDQTGGAMYKADEPSELDGIFERIDKELRTQYRLAYYPSPRPPARALRTIEVRLAGEADTTSKYTIRHRRSYYTGDE
ncbi:MAG: hypothetical protein HY046_13240, partial [Acidobacteria bacterium]|nr:hypothetical protein [Acidobacteriota bacterium]